MFPFIIFIILIFLTIGFLTINMLYTKKSLYAIYYLIAIFFLSIISFFIIGIEFISILYLLIYLGAIIVLYIISIYTLGSNLIDDFEEFINYKLNWIICFFFSSVLLVYLWVGSYFNFLEEYTNHFYHRCGYNFYKKISINIDVLAYLIFDYYSVALFLGGVILLIAMVGAIMLTIPFFIKSKPNISIINTK